MARLNQWSFRNQILNSTNVRIRAITGAFGLPPLRGDDFLTMGRTGRLFVPKIHDERSISLEIIVRDTPYGTAAGIFDQFAIWAANRAQGSLANILDSGPRTGQAECTAWLPQDMGVGGVVFHGVATFRLADPWMYGTIVSGNVVPASGLAFGTPVVSNIAGPQTTWAAVVSGLTSGQPLLVVHMTVGYTTVLTSIADTFGGHYTYTKVDGANAILNDCEIYIGTGGTGTSGTVTVTAPSGLIGGMVVPLFGASASAGLGAIDAHGNASSSSLYTISVPLTPTAAAEGYLMAATTVAGCDISGYSGSFGYVVSYAGHYVGEVGMTPNPPNGVSYAPTMSSTSPKWDAAACIVKGTGATGTLNLTNSGTATCEKLVIDILGPITNPTITNTTNGTSLTINVGVGGTKHLIVDTGAYTALFDGVNVIGSVSHSGAVPFLTLTPGANVLQVSGANCTGSTLVTVSFYPPFV